MTDGGHPDPGHPQPIRQSHGRGLVAHEHRQDVSDGPFGWGGAQRLLECPVHHSGSCGCDRSQLMARLLTVPGDHEFESGGCSSSSSRNGSRGENETAGPVHQEIDQGPRAGNETAGSPQRLAQSSHADFDPRA